MAENTRSHLTYVPIRRRDRRRATIPRLLVEVHRERATRKRGVRERLAMASRVSCSCRLTMVFPRLP
jgi:hypothetical protein